MSIALRDLFLRCDAKECTRKIICGKGATEKCPTNVCVNKISGYFDVCPHIRVIDTADKEKAG